jgi:glycosyltransferase involved in cell wall biosynthesis
MARNPRENWLIPHNLSKKSPDQSDMATQEIQNIEPLLPLPFPLEPRNNLRPTLCVIIPVFNEEAVLAHTFAELSAVLDQIDVDWSILFVNDGSRDNTPMILESLFRQDERVAYILLSRNFGHQAALTAGFDHADADIVISMDGDMQHPPSLIASLVAAWQAGYDIVHTRKLQTHGLSRTRAIPTRIAYAIVQRVSQTRLIPNASDYRLLDRQALEAIRSLPEGGRLYRGLTSWVGFRQCVVPYIAADRAAGTSQYGFRQLFGLFSRALFDFSNLPLYLGLLVGGIAICLSALYLVFILAWLLLGKEAPPGWASSISVTLLLNSITLVFIGIIGAYVARIYNQVRARPTYMLSLIKKAGTGPQK